MRLRIRRRGVLAGAPLVALGLGAAGACTLSPVRAGLSRQDTPPVEPAAADAPIEPSAPDAADRAAFMATIDQRNLTWRRIQGEVFDAVAAGGPRPKETYTVTRVQAKQN